MSKFRSTSGFKWINLKEFDLDKYAKNSLKGCVLKVNHKYPKELRETHKDYPFEPDKIEIKRKMVSNYQLRIADLYNILFTMLKKYCLTFLIKKNMSSKKIHRVLELFQCQWLKEYVEFNTQKIIEAERNGDKD